MHPLDFGGWCIHCGALRGGNGGQAPASCSGRALLIWVPFAPLCIFSIFFAPEQCSRRRGDGLGQSRGGRGKESPRPGRGLPGAAAPVCQGPPGPPRSPGPRLPRRCGAADPAAPRRGGGRSAPPRSPAPAPPLFLPGGRFRGSLLLAAAGFLSPGFRAAPSHPPPERDGVRASEAARMRPGCPRRQRQQQQRRMLGGAAAAPQPRSPAGWESDAMSRPPAAARE